MAGLAVWVLILYFAVLPFMIKLGFSNIIIAFRFGDAITWIVPPALPIFVSMCMTYSLVRLR
jgi:cation-transporting ATPase 13A2